MKQILIIGLSLMISVLPGAAETLYVSGDSGVNLRSGSGTRHTVIDTIDPGQELRVLENHDDWTKVALPDGKEGWMATRLLTDKKPAEAVAKECRQKLERLGADLESLRAENERLIIENQSLHQKLEETINQLTQARQAHEALMEESADFLSLKESHEMLSKQLREKTDIITSLENQLAITNRSSMIYWFLAGAGVLILGMIIGAAMKRKRTKFI